MGREDLSGLDEQGLSGVISRPAEVFPLDESEMVEVLQMVFDDTLTESQAVEKIVKFFFPRSRLVWKRDGQDEPVPSSRLSKCELALFYRGEELNLYVFLEDEPFFNNARVGALKFALATLERERMRGNRASELLKAVAFIIHNQRNHIAAALMAMGVIFQRIGSSGEELKDLRKMIEQSVGDFNRLTKTAVGLLTSREGKLNIYLKALTPNEVTKLLLERYSRHEINFNLNFSDCTYVYMDVELFFEVMENIISNAVKYGHPADQRLIIDVSDADESLTISVKDSGFGFVGDGEDLFNYGLRRAERGEEGFGIGLAFCNQVITKMEGKMFAGNNIDGRGATFGMKFPLKYI